MKLAEKNIDSDSVDSFRTLLREIVTAKLANPSMNSKFSVNFSERTLCQQSQKNSDSMVSVSLREHCVSSQPFTETVRESLVAQCQLH